MKVLIVHAHPEPQSFTAALRDQAMATFRAQGHAVKVSDLYAMGWNPVASADDFTQRENPEYLVYALEQRQGVKRGAIAADIQQELDKMSAQGWELVSTLFIEHEVSVRLFFKKPA